MHNNYKFLVILGIFYYLFVNYLIEIPHIILCKYRMVQSGAQLLNTLSERSPSVLRSSKQTNLSSGNKTRTITHEFVFQIL